MPYTYTRDDQRRRIVIALRGAFTATEGLATVEQRRADVDAVSYGVLYDVRADRATHRGRFEALYGRRNTAGSRQAASSAARPDGVSRDRASAVQKACTYPRSEVAASTIEVFRDFDEADTWLENKSDQLAGFRRPHDQPSDRIAGFETQFRQHDLRPQIRIRQHALRVRRAWL